MNARTALRRGLRAWSRAFVAPGQGRLRVLPVRELAQPAGRHATAPAAMLHAGAWSRLPAAASRSRSWQAPRGGQSLRRQGERRSPSPERAGVMRPGFSDRFLPGSPLVRLAWLGMAGLAMALLVLAPAHAQAPAAELAAAEPDGYRMDAYRAPTPATLKGARVIDTAEAERLWRAKSAIFVDVLPRDVKPANLAPGTLWRDKPREHLPGSVWLPNVGYGALSEAMDAYFRHGLETIAGGRREAPLVFYCQSECWMSWNAARRAMAYGYADVIWFPQGTDGWAKAGLPLEKATPLE